MIAVLLVFPACSFVYALLKVHSSLKVNTATPVPPVDRRRIDLEEATSSKMNEKIMTKKQQGEVPANQPTYEASQRTSQLATQDGQHCRVDKPPIAPKSLRKGIRSKYTDEQYYQNAVKLVQSISPAAGSVPIIRCWASSQEIVSLAKFRSQVPIPEAARARLRR